MTKLTGMKLSHVEDLFICYQMFVNILIEACKAQNYSSFLEILFFLLHKKIIDIYLHSHLREIVHKKFGSLAQLVQSTCLTSRGSLVRIQ